MDAIHGHSRDRIGAMPPTNPATPTLITLNFKLTAEQRERIARTAAASGNTSLGAVIRLLIDRHLDDLLPSR